MIQLHRAEPKDASWRKWRAKAELCTRELRRAWAEWLEAAAAADQPISEFRKQNPPPKIDDDLYKDQADVIKGWSGGRCAYCEALIVEKDQPGDVEHYRPKRALTDDAGKVVEGHHGYYWLAYEWTNLMGACILCNRPTTSPEEKARGKRNKFPIREDRGRAFKDTDDLSAEQPMLLDPFDPSFDTDTHFEFKDNGVIVGLTDEAEETIRVLDLNRRGLRAGRQDAWELTQNAMANVNLDVGPERRIKAICRLKRIVAGQVEFCGAARAKLAPIRSDPMGRAILEAALAQANPDCLDGPRAASG